MRSPIKSLTTNQELKRATPTVSQECIYRFMAVVLRAWVRVCLADRLYVQRRTGLSLLEPFTRPSEPQFRKSGKRAYYDPQPGILIMCGPPVANKWPLSSSGFWTFKSHNLCDFYSKTALSRNYFTYKYFFHVTHVKISRSL